MLIQYGDFNPLTFQEELIKFHAIYCAKAMQAT